MREERDIDDIVFHLFRHHPTASRGGPLPRLCTMWRTTPSATCATCWSPGRTEIRGRSSRPISRNIEKESSVFRTVSKGSQDGASPSGKVEVVNPQLTVIPGKRMAKGRGRLTRLSVLLIASATMVLFGGGGALLATSAGAAPAHSVQDPTPSGNNGTTIDPLQYNCGNDAPTCGQVGESNGYYNGTNVDLLYSENYYCDANVSSGATSGCEVGAGPSPTPSAASAGNSGTSLGNTT